MNFKKFLLGLCISFSTQTFTNEYLIGFGSCVDQDFPQPIWNSIKDKNIDSFMFLGDNVYGDEPSGNLVKLKKSYETQLNLFPEWLKQKKIISIWDDHDYGINDGGGDFVNKYESQKLFLDFWNIPNNDVRHSREGLYFNELLDIDGFKVNIIVLDTRFFRSKLNSNKAPYIPNDNKSTTILGDAQWSWFEEVLQQESDLILVLSSIQVIPKEHIFEKWQLFPHERLRLINLLESQKTKSLILSGDRHKGGLYKKGNLIELTSSSLNKPTSAARRIKKLRFVPNFLKKELIETDEYLVTKIYNYENFGLIKIKSDTKDIEISLNDIDGKIIFSNKI